MKDRIEKLREELKENEAALITDSADRFYFTGFNSSAGTVFITKNTAAFIIDFRYYEKACREVCGFEILLAENLKKQLGNIAVSEKIKCVYVRTQRMSMREYNLYNTMLGGILCCDDRLDRVITKLRSIKTNEEIEFIRQAQKYTDDTFSYILGRIEEGRTEREIMLDMEFYMRSLGSEGTAFDFIVVSGKNSSLPHGVPTDKAIQKGDFITMDFGAVYNGYRSDMTRTVAVGGVSDEQRRVYNTVLKAQLSALNEIGPGKVCRNIDSTARNFIAENGYDGCFGHGLGHSVGIEIHEEPCFNTRCDEILKPGMIMTVEPGIYISDSFGVRIEDMVVITDNGYDNLTKSQKDLIIL